MSAQRWAYLVRAGAIGACADLLFLALAPGFLRGAINVPSWAFLLVIILGVLLLGHVARGRVLAFLGLRHFLAYPPLWVGALFGLAILFAVLAAADEVRALTPLVAEDAWAIFRASVAVVILGIGVPLVPRGVVLVYAKLRSRTSAASSPEERHTATKGLAALHASFERICSWASTDEPVETPSDDAFERHAIARRIMSRLRAWPAPAQAVVGGLGSGKTTLRHLVAAELRATGAPEIVLVPVELWPYETPRAAVEGVIRALVDEVAQEVPVVALRGIPDVYAEAMSAAGGPWNALVRIQGIPATPFDALRRIDDIATMIGRLVRGLGGGPRALRPWRRRLGRCRARNP